jgi:microcystin-dependent protein
MVGVPLKTIVAWYSSGPGDSPGPGWAICDGSVLTVGTQDINLSGNFTLPDLRNRFLLGADNNKALLDAGVSGDLASNAPGPGGLGGSQAVTLSSNNFPSHTHTGTVGAAPDINTSILTRVGEGNHAHTGTTAVSVGGSHTHTVSLSAVSDHSHSVTLSGGTHDHATTSGSDFPAHTHSTFGSGVTSNDWLLFNTTRPPNFSAAAGPTLYQTNVGTPATNFTTGAPSNPHQHNVIITAQGGHSHSGSTSAAGGHNHTATVSSDTGHSHGISWSGNDGGHRHTLDFTLPGHAHSLTINASGGGSTTPFDNRPRYFGVVYIMKVRH